MPLEYEGSYELEEGTLFETMGREKGILFETMGKMKAVVSTSEYKKLKKQGWTVVQKRTIRGRTTWIMRSPTEPKPPRVAPPRVVQPRVAPPRVVQPRVAPPRVAPKPIAVPMLEKTSILIDQQKKQIIQLKNMLTASNRRYEQLENRFKLDRIKYTKSLNQQKKVIIEQRATINEKRNQIEALKKELEKYTKKTGIESCTYSPDTPYKAYGYNPISGRKQWFRDVKECELFYSQYK